MCKSIFQKLLVLSIIGVFASANVFADTTPQTLSGKFYVGDRWVAGTLTADKIERTEDDLGNVTVTGTGNWKFEGSTGTYSGSNLFRTLYEEGKGCGGNNNSKTKGKIISTNEGLSISSDELLDVKIYDLLGKVVYTATDINNLSLDRNTLNLNNGTYMLRSANKEGKEERAMFLLNGNSFIISNSKE